MRAAFTRSLNAAPAPATAETVMTRSRSLRSMVGGVMRSTTLPRSRTRIPFPSLLYIMMFSRSSIDLRNSGA
ncbi:hypothetical protein EVA_07001 [gut metagenome]|uniref:Uncharacterized protein n=1 Tax=gut metagenome TaxID=749906 RepID=J9GW93_9ZZZZ